MKSKFKVGDTIRCTCANHQSGMKKGDITTVIAVSSLTRENKGNYIQTLNGSFYDSFFEHHIEGVPVIDTSLPIIGYVQLGKHKMVFRTDVELEYINWFIKFHKLAK